MKAFTYLLLLGGCIASAFIFWVIAVFAAKYYSFYVSHDNIILTMVGILATFVVVSNYVQIADIRKEFNIRVSELEKMENDIRKEFNNKVSELEKMESDIMRVKVQTFIEGLRFEESEYDKVIRVLDFILRESPTINTVSTFTEHIYTSYDKYLRNETPQRIKKVYEKALKVSERYPNALITMFSDRTFIDFIDSDLKDHAESYL